MIVPILQEELFSAPLMFKVSALINLVGQKLLPELKDSMLRRHCAHITAYTKQVSVIGHTKYGYDYYYPCLNTIPEKPANRLVKHGSSGVWNSVNATLFIAGK